jgi:hypothetical protein
VLSAETRLARPDSPTRLEREKTGSRTHGEHAHAPSQPGTSQHPVPYAPQLLCERPNLTFVEPPLTATDQPVGPAVTAHEPAPGVQQLHSVGTRRG